VLDADGIYDLPRLCADSVLRCRVGTRTGCAGTRPFWQCGTTYHVGLDRTHTHIHTHTICLRIQVELHYALPYVTAYPVAPHPPTGFVPAPTQPPTYGGKMDLPLTSNLQVSRRFFHSLDFDSRCQKMIFFNTKNNCSILIISFSVME